MVYDEFVALDVLFARLHAVPVQPGALAPSGDDVLVVEFAQVRARLARQVVLYQRLPQRVHALDALDHVQITAREIGLVVESSETERFEYLLTYFRGRNQSE